MLGILRKWLQDRFTLQRPTTATVQFGLAPGGWEGKGPPLPTAKVIPLRTPGMSDNRVRLCRPPQADSLELLLPVDSVAVDCDLLTRFPPSPQRIVAVRFPLPYPDVFDMFTGLLYPAPLGKAYERSEPRPKEKEKPDYQASLQPELEERCRHGLPRYLCEICSAESARGQGGFQGSSYQRAPSSGQVGATTPSYDVFDLLLPYLQPPLEVLLGNLTLFPEGRRPYPYQVDGILFLTQHHAALLGDEMGLGKTIQAILALQLLVRRAEIRRALIVCRRSLLSVWEAELHKWAPELYVTKVRGTPELRERLWRLSNSVLFLTTYGTLAKDAKRFPRLLAHRFDVVILDEIQEIKNPGTQKSRAVRKLEPRYRWGLSGTPLENSLEDVVAIFEFLEPSLFHQPSLFDGFDSAMLYPWDVKERIRPYFLRRRTRDVLHDLPEKIINEVWLELLDGQREAYDLEFARARDQLSQRGTTRIHVFTWINKLKQLCNLDPETGQSCKLEYLKDQLEGVTGAGQKALVFSHFPNVTLRRIEKRLRDFDPAIFDGTLSDRERKQLIDTFQKKDTPQVLLMSIKTGGTGLTITRANHVFHFDHWWNPAVARQAEGRAHRIGQKLTVFVYDIYTEDTIEERIYKLLRTKEALFDMVIDDLSESRIRQHITDEELFALFDLEPSARSRSEQQ